MQSTEGNHYLHHSTLQKGLQTAQPQDRSQNDAVSRAMTAENGLGHVHIDFLVFRTRPGALSP